LRDGVLEGLSEVSDQVFDYELVDGLYHSVEYVLDELEHPFSILFVSLISLKVPLATSPL
jgi:hypothetical protein